jgi:GNAT superfamily N-acetyltransferase
MSASATRFAVEVRVAKPEDFARVAELAGELGYPSKTEEIARRIDGMKNSSEHAAFVAQLSNGEIAGWVGVFVYRAVEADARAEVSGLVVDARFRSKQVGLRLLERAEQWAHEKSCKVVGLRSNVIRDRAHAFYERNGYEHRKTQKSFRKNL